MAGMIPPGTDLAADEVPRITGATITFIVLPTVFVLLRLTSRRLSRAGYWWDDLLVVIACVLSYLPCIFILLERQNGLGRHIYAIKDPEANASRFFKDIYFWLIFYSAACTFNKLAILAFYRRVFTIPPLRPVLLIATVVVLCQFIAKIIVDIIPCRPISSFWDFDIHGKCLNKQLVLVVPGAVNCVLDFLIIFLPIPLLWRLRTTGSQKRVLTGIFFCAGFVCVISIIRLITVSNISESDYTSIWSNAEPSMGVVSACIPSLRPLVSLIARGTTRAAGASSSGGGGKGSSQDPSSSGIKTWRSRVADEDKDGSFARLDDPMMDYHPGPQWEASAQGGKVVGARGRKDEISLEEINRPDGRIRVKNEVTVSYSDWRLDYKDRVF